VVCLIAGGGEAAPPFFPAGAPQRATLAVAVAAPLSGACDGRPSPPRRGRSGGARGPADLGPLRC